MPSTTPHLSRPPAPRAGGSRSTLPTAAPAALRAGGGGAAASPMGRRGAVRAVRCRAEPCCAGCWSLTGAAGGSPAPRRCVTSPGRGCPGQPCLRRREPRPSRSGGGEHLPGQAQVRSPRSPRFPGRPCCRPGLAPISGARGSRCAAGPPSCPWLEVSGEGRGACAAPAGRAAAAHRSAPLRGEGRLGRRGCGAGVSLHLFPFPSPRFSFWQSRAPLVPAASRFGGHRAGFSPASVAGRTCCPRCGAGCAAPGGAVRECRRRDMAPAGPCPSAALLAFLPSAERSISRGRSAWALIGVRKVTRGARRGWDAGARRGRAAQAGAWPGEHPLVSPVGADEALKPLFGAWGQS